MANKPFEIQSTAISINGVKLDTAANGKLVIPGVTRAASSVAIEVNDTGDQTTTWTDIPVVTDGYTYAVYITGEANGLVGYAAATYAVDALDGDGYIDGITVVDGGANYTGEAVTYSQTMWAAPAGTAIDSSTNGLWTEIPFAVRCGAGDVESEFGGGSGNGNQIVNTGNTKGLTVNADGDAVLFTVGAPGDAVNRGLRWDYGAANGGVDSYILQNNAGLTIQSYADTFFGPNGSPVNVRTGDSNSEWNFNPDGSVTFPDGSVQTTAYTGQGGTGTGWGLQYGANDNVSNSGQTFNSVTVDVSGNSYYFGGSVYEVSGNYVPLIVKVDPTGTVLWSTSITNYEGAAIGGNIIVIPGGPTFLAVFVEDESDNVTTKLWNVTIDKDTGVVMGGQKYVPTMDAGIGVNIQKTWTAPLAVGWSGFTTGENRVVTLNIAVSPMPGLDVFSVLKTDVPGLTSNNYYYCYIDSTNAIVLLTDGGDYWTVWTTGANIDFTTGTHTIQIPQNANAMLGLSTIGSFNWITVGTSGFTFENYASTAFDPMGGYIYAVGNDQNNHSIISKFDTALAPIWHKNIDLVLTNHNVSDVAVDSAGAVYVVSDSNDSGYITKIDGNGGVIWRRRINADNQPFGMNGLNITINGQDDIVVAAGYYGSAFSQNDDIYLIKFDVDGNVVWQRSIGTSRSDNKGSSYSLNDTNGFITSDLTSFYLALNVNYGPGPANAGAVKLPLDGSDLGSWGVGNNRWTYQEESWPIDTIDVTAGSTDITTLIVSAFSTDTTTDPLNTVDYIFPVQVAQFGSINNRLVNNGYSVTLDSTGAVNLSNYGVIRNQVAEQAVNIVSNNYSQLQWTTDVGVASEDPNSTGEPFNWLYVDQGGTWITNSVNTGYDEPEWHFDTNGGLRFPDHTVQRTAFKDFNKSWASFIGNGVNDNDTDNDYGSQIYTTVVHAMLDGTVVVGGWWNSGDNALLFHYDKDGRELWRWMDNFNGGADSHVVSITEDGGKLIVAIRGQWYWENNPTRSTRIYRFTKHEKLIGTANYWQVEDPNGQDSVNVRDANQAGRTDVKYMFSSNGNLVVLGEAYGETFTAYSGQAGAGSGVGVIRIPVSSITAYNGTIPNTQDGNWTLSYNGSTWYLDWQSLGRFSNPAWSTNGAGAGAEFTVWINYKTHQYEVQQNASTTGFVDGDTITIKGSALNGQDSLTINATTVDSDTSGILMFDPVMYPDLASQLNNGRTWIVRGGPLPPGGASIQSIATNSTQVTITLGHNLTGGLSVDNYSFTSSGNDITMVVNSAIDGVITSLSPPLGTPSESNIYINFGAWFGDTEDHSATGYTYVIAVHVNSEAFVHNRVDDYNKKISTAGYGRFQSGLYTQGTDNSLYIGGETWDSLSSPSLSLSLVKVDRTGNIVWNKSIQADNINGWDSGVYGMTDSGTSIWTVDLWGAVMEISYDGEILYQSQLDGNNIYYDYGSTNIKYLDGYIYVGGKVWSDWNSNSWLIEKIDAKTKQPVWSRQISSRYAGLWYSDGQSKHMDVNREGVFITGNGYMGANDNRQNGFILKLALNNPPGQGIDYLDQYSADAPVFDNGWFICDSFDGENLTGYRHTSNHILVNRTHDTWTDSTVVYNGGEGISQVFPRFVSQYASLDSKGFSFNDNTGELRHNPAYIPQSQPDFGNMSYQYTLKLSDAGKFIRNIPYDNSYCTVHVPNESQVMFPIGTVITFVNMIDWNSNNIYLYINVAHDYNNTFDGYDSPKIYLAGYNGSHSNSWGLKGRGTATLMKVGPNEWLLTGDCVNTD